MSTVPNHFKGTALAYADKILQPFDQSRVTNASLAKGIVPNVRKRVKIIQIFKSGGRNEKNKLQANFGSHSLCKII